MTHADEGHCMQRSKRIIAYFFGWNADERQIAMLDQAAPPLTHINYAFGLIRPDGRAILGNQEAEIERAYAGTDDGPDGLRGNFRQLQLLKERHPHLRTLISMGGWTGSGGFSDACATADGRRELASSCIELFLTPSAAACRTTATAPRTGATARCSLRSCGANSISSATPPGNGIS
jgi:GH18 family chitinase